MNNSFLKLILIGDGRVGKTSIINKYIHNKFNENEGMTLNCCYMEKTIIHNARKYKFSIWDTAGQEKFNAITPIYYRDARGVILVYDITNPNSFERVKKWIEELKNYNENASIVIVGNKIDLKEEDLNNINQETAIKYTEEKQFNHFFTSAKTGENLNEVFDCIMKLVIEKYEKEKKGQTGFGRKNKKVILTKDEENESQGKDYNRGWCCGY